MMAVQLQLPQLWPLSEVMWAAGFYEGEGTVGERNALVSQVNLWPLERLVRVFGGRVGRSSRTDSRRIGRSQPIWQWAICGPRGRDFVAAIYPHLSPRRQAQIDAKFITWERFNLRRQQKLSPKQKAHLDRVVSHRNVVTGRFGNAS